MPPASVAIGQTKHVIFKHVNNLRCHCSHKHVQPQPPEVWGFSPSPTYDARCPNHCLRNLWGTMPQTARLPSPRANPSSLAALPPIRWKTSEFQPTICFLQIFAIENIWLDVGGFVPTVIGSLAGQPCNGLFDFIITKKFGDKNLIGQRTSKRWPLNNIQIGENAHGPHGLEAGVF